MITDMNKLISVAILATIAIMPQDANATENPITGRDFLNVCSIGGVWEAYCIGMVDGIGYVMSVQGETKSKQAYKICVPPKISTGEQVQVFVDWLEGNPHQWPSDGRSLAMLALGLKWPCPE
jgi:hypothetical protein